MLFLKHVLWGGGLTMIATAAGILVYDLRGERQSKLAIAAGASRPAPPVRWRTSLALAMLACGPILLALGIVLVPSGMAGVLVNQTSGTLPGTLYPGALLVVPFAETVACFLIHATSYSPREHSKTEARDRRRSSNRSTCRQKKD